MLKFVRFSMTSLDSRHFVENLSWTTYKLKLHSLPVIVTLCINAEIITIILVIWISNIFDQKTIESICLWVCDSLPRIKTLEFMWDVGLVEFKRSQTLSMIQPQKTDGCQRLIYPPNHQCIGATLFRNEISIIFLLI